jgi:hypothetical protein
LVRNHRLHVSARSTSLECVGNWPLHA